MLINVCIPTYNGETKIKECLTRIVPVVEQFEDVSIIICDNNSTDNTKGVIDDFFKVFPRIKYYKNEINIGADRNFEKILQLADADFAWLLGNDDYFSYESFKAVYEQLDKKYDMVFVNSYNRIKNVENQVFTGGKAVIRALGAHLTFLSCLIFNVEKVQTLDTKGKYYDTWFLQTGLVYEILANPLSKALWIEDNTIFSCDVAKCAFMNEYFRTFTDRLYDFSQLLPDYYSNEDKDYYVRSHCVYTAFNKFGFLLHIRSQGQFNLKHIFCRRKVYKKCLGERIYAKLILSALFPIFVYRALRYIKHKFKGCDQTT